MQFTFYDFIGSIGVGLIILTYILLTNRKNQKRKSELFRAKRFGRGV